MKQNFIYKKRVTANIRKACHLAVTKNPELLILSC